MSKIKKRTEEEGGDRWGLQKNTPQREGMSQEWKWEGGGKRKWMMFEREEKEKED